MRTIVAVLLAGLAAVVALVAFELIIQAIDVQAERDGAPDARNGCASPRESYAAVSGRTR
ncbi:hypothetical protein [Leifsonia lichenia]